MNQLPSPTTSALVPLFATSGSGVLTSLDWLTMGLYFGVLLGVAWWVVRRRKDTAADYFLAGRNLGWWVIGASIFASNIGSEHVVGLAGSGAKDGVAMAHYELHAWCLLVLAWVFVPFYARSLVFTMPEFLERRFFAGSRYVLSVVSLITFVVSKIAVGIFAGGVVFATLLPEVKIDTGRAASNRQFLDRLGAGDRADRAVHHAGRDAGRGLQRRGPDRRPHLRLGVADLLRPATRWAAGAGWAREFAVRRCSTSGNRCFPRAWKALGPR